MSKITGLAEAGGGRINQFSTLGLAFNFHFMTLIKMKGQRKYNFHFQSLRTFAPKSSYGEIFFISPLELVHKVLTPKMKKKMGVTDFVSEKMAVEKCLNFDKSVIIKRCSLLC